MVSTRRPTRSSLLAALSGALLLLGSCATAPKRTENPPRMSDAAPEKVASQRAAAPHGLQLEQDDERWGIEAAKERRRQQDAAKARKQSTEQGAKNVDVTAPPR